MLSQDALKLDLPTWEQYVCDVVWSVEGDLFRFPSEEDGLIFDYSQKAIHVNVQSLMVAAIHRIEMGIVYDFWVKCF